MLRQLRHIVTKAVIAKGKKRTESCETLRPPNSPSSILGCWVINHTYSAKKNGKFVEVNDALKLLKHDDAKNALRKLLNKVKTG